MDWAAVGALIGAAAIIGGLVWLAIKAHKTKPWVTVRAGRQAAYFPVSVTVQNRSTADLNVRSIRAVQPAARLALLAGLRGERPSVAPSAPGGELIIDWLVLAGGSETLWLCMLDMPVQCGRHRARREARRYRVVARRLPRASRDSSDRKHRRMTLRRK
jgi:hypothetical protein